MTGELQVHLQDKARELCRFFDHLSFLDQGLLLSIIAVMSEDSKPAKDFVAGLEKRRKYKKIAKNPLLT